MRQYKVLWFTLILAALAGWNVWAQEKFPSRPIEMIVNFGTGGGADQLGRVAAQLLEPVLGVAVPVSNVAGASGNTGLAKVSSAQPDGYTIGTLTGISISAWASGMGRLTINDFAYIGVVQSSPSMLFVVSDSPFKNYQQLLDHAKANPDKIKVATAGFGTLDVMVTPTAVASGSGYSAVNLAVPSGWVLTAIGGNATFNSAGRMLTDMVPYVDSAKTQQGATIRSKDHEVADIGQTAAVVIAARKH